jgi:hypothetical protein
MERKLSSTFLIVLKFLSSCNWKKDKMLHVDVSGISIPQVKIHRYDIDLFKIPLNDLQKGLESIKNQYPFFLGTELTDPVKLGQMKEYLSNQRNIDFHDACLKKYQHMGAIENNLTTGFKHFKYYFPNAQIPRVYTYISGGDYENPVQLIDNVMIIALDTYLGKDFKPYFSDGIPSYKARNMTSDYIVPDCMKALVDRVYRGNPTVTNLLGQIVEAGKKLFFVDAMIPDLPGNVKIGYTTAQFNWISKNESHVWAAIIENGMLYSTDNQVVRIFMADGPFTPEFTRESPPRLGEWIGWQIVKKYMEMNPDVSLPQMMNESDPQKILTLSGYKPKK